MRFRPRPLTILLTMALLGIVASAQSRAVYVESNRAENNSILAFKNNGGSLSFIGEFLTNGKGVFDLSLKLGPFDSDQNIITNPAGTRLFARASAFTYSARCTLVAVHRPLLLL